MTSAEYLKKLNRFKQFEKIAQAEFEDLFDTYDFEYVWSIVYNMDGQANARLYDTYEYAREELQLTFEFWLAQLGDRVSLQELTDGKSFSIICEAKTGELLMESGGFIYAYLKKTPIESKDKERAIYDRG